MDYKKEYLLQLLTACTNKLRLDTSKLELVALLKEEINRSGDPTELFRNMKRITEFAKLAIKLNEFYLFISTSRIDYQTISQRFHSHTDTLLKDLSPFLDSLSGLRFREAINRLNGSSNLEKTVTKTDNGLPVIDFSAPKGHRIINIEAVTEAITAPESEVQEIEETVESSYETLDFAKFESAVLSPIKGLDELLKQILNEEMPKGELSFYSQVMYSNYKMAVKFNSETVARMHKTVSKALLMIRDGDLKPTKTMIESVRACLIVIVAIVRNKDIDFKVYLDNAEEFSAGLLENKK